MNVEIISVGTEILMGNIVNTNAAFLARECADLGLFLYHQSVVGDNEERLYDAVKTAYDRSDLVILTGGLGPTKDDLTKETVAKTLGKTLVEDENTKKRLSSYFELKQIKDIPANNWKQAMVPEGAIVVDNENGTAPGIIIECDNEKRVIMLPGPPKEMQPMFQEKIIPYLKKISNQVLYSKMVKVCGIGESKAEMMVMDLMENQSNPTIAPYAKTREVHFRVTGCAETEEEAKKIVKPIVKELKFRFGDAVYTTDEKVTLEESVVKLLKKHDLKIVTAESCTGGLIAARLVNVPGASSVLEESFVTYSNKAKRKYLGVSKSTLKEYTEVSEKTAKEMARGAAVESDSDIAVAVTGLAGPGGGTKERPVGLVYISCYAKEKTVVKEYHFNGNRESVREQAVIAALDLVRHCILENYSS